MSFAFQDLNVKLNCFIFHLNECKLMLLHGFYFLFVESHEHYQLLDLYFLFIYLHLSFRLNYLVKS
jgi:hypothetical protein